MRRSFIILEGTYKAKAASVVFLIFKKTYLQAWSVFICSIGKAVLFAGTKTSKICVFLGQVVTSQSLGSLMLCI